VAGTPAAGGFERLRFAHHDAIAVFNALARGRRSSRALPAGKLHNGAFDAVEASVLTNADATREAILRELQRLCRLIQARADRAGAERDVLVVFLSGHGVRFKGEPELFFWCHDARPQTMEQSGLPLLDVGQLIGSVPAEVVLVVDACHAAMAGGNVVGGLDAEELARRLHAVNERAMVVIAASRAEEEAREDGVGGLGVLTGALIETLFGSRRDVSLMDLVAGVQREVPRLTARAGVRPQTPVCRVFGELLPLTIFRR
jgi:uncharacterized caspase-like protein